MSTRKLQLPVAGFTDGLNTEASVLNVLPSEFMSGTTNVVLHQNGSVRRRKGVDFLGASDAGGFLQTVRTSSISAELKQESPAIKFVRLTAPNGSIVEKIVADVNNEFWVFDVTSFALTNINSPTQTISRTVDGILHSYAEQKFVNMQFSQSGNRLFFAGKHIHPGYLQVSADNETLEVVYINILIRNPDASEINTQRKNGSPSVGYECIKDHTSAASSEPGVGVDWETYWFANEGSTTASAWAGSTAYTTTFLNRYDKRVSVVGTDTFPTTVDFFAGRAWYSGDPKFPNNVYFSQVVVNDGDLEKFHQFADPFDADDPAIVADDGGVIAFQGAGLVLRLLTLGTSIFVCSNTGVFQVSGPNASFKATDFTTFSVLKDGIDGPENVIAVDDEFIIYGQDTIWRSTIQSSLNVTTAGQATFKSLSENRVETLYTSIPRASKAAARALYNPSERRAYYFYNASSTDFDNSYNILEQPGYSKDVLVLDTRFQDDILPTEQQQKLRRTVKGAFFSYSFNDGANGEKPYIACPFIAPDVPPVDEAVVAGGVIIIDDATPGVEIVASGAPDPQDVILAMALRRSEVGSNAIIQAAFASMNTTTLRDWNSSSSYAVSYSSPVFSGVQTGGDALHNKNLTYVHLVFERVEGGVLDNDGNDLTPGGCFMSISWDYATTEGAPGHTNFGHQVTSGSGANSVTAGGGTLVFKRDPMREVYVAARFTNDEAGAGSTDYSHVYYKHRVRGRGKAFQMLFLNDGDKDYNLIGWAEQFHGTPD
jgi:hypothetical protein